MILVSDSVCASICVEKEGWDGVRRVAGKVANDIELVTGKKATVVSELSSDGPRVVAATVGKSAYLEKLVAEERVDLSQVTGKWEVYLFAVIPATDSEPETLLIAGSDKRGTIYGLFHLSELMGVSPWVWFGDVTPVHRDVIEITKADELLSKEPSVRYRGFFINDEWPAYGNWTFEHFGGFTADMYDHVFELLLRLKGNYLWPAMWTSNFSLDGPGLENARLADEYGVVMSNSHHEPCLRHSEEWDLVKGEDTPFGTAWNFDQNKQGLTNYWREGLRRNGDFENIITMGMRGERDSEVLGQTATLQDNIDYLKEVIETQNMLIREVISEDLDKTHRMLAIYKEVERYFHGGDGAVGLKTWDGLDGITCMLCEDNFGNLRTLPEEGMRDRKGGWGMYYHFDYHGDPVSYEWINSTHIARTCEQMSQAYDYGIREIWIVNVGDLKPQELPLSYFLDLAYDMDKWGVSNPNATQEYLKKWVSMQFPGLAAEQESIAKLLEGYTRMNYIRKPEALGTETYHVTNYGEAKAMLAYAEDLDRLADELWEKVSNRQEADAIFQLVVFPAQAAANLVKLQLTAGLNNYLAKCGALYANVLADRVQEYIERDRELMRRYHTLNGGKWNGLMLSEHVGFTNWNDEECRYPLRAYVHPANKLRMIVTTGNGSEMSMGGDWTRQTLVNLALADAAVNTTTITVYNGWDGALDCKITCDSDFVTVSEKEFSVDLVKEILVTADRSKMSADAEATITVSVQGYHVDIVLPVAAKKLSDDEVVCVPASCMERKNRFARRGHAVEENELGLVLEMKDAVKIVNSEAGSYQLLPGFGKFDGGLKAFPTLATFTPGVDSPYAEFEFTAAADGFYNFTFVTAPNNPVVKGNTMSIGVQLCDEEIASLQLVSPKYEGGERTCPDWAAGVMKQTHEVTLGMNVKSGKNTLRIFAADPGVTLERVLIHEGATNWAPGYLGKVPEWI